jgi:hypothetical protein
MKDNELEREVDRYTTLQILKDSLKIAVIFLVSFFVISWLAEHGAKIDYWCNYFLRP